MPKYMNVPRLYGPRPFAFDLQRFAEAGTGDGKTESADMSEGKPESASKPEAAPESKAEDKQTEEDIDERIAKAVKAAQAKFEKDFTKKQEAAKKEQERLSKLSDDEHKAAESFAGNVSGIAIKYKLIGLEQIRSHKERWFKKGLQRRIELIGGMLKLKNAADIDFRDIEITFTANLPANSQEQAQIVKDLCGIVSQKRLLSLLPFVTDPAEELEELKKEQDDDTGDYENFQTPAEADTPQEA